MRIRLGAADSRPGTSRHMIPCNWHRRKDRTRIQNRREQAHARQRRVWRAVTPCPAANSGNLTEYSGQPVQYLQHRIRDIKPHAHPQLCMRAAFRQTLHTWQDDKRSLTCQVFVSCAEWIPDARNSCSCDNPVLVATLKHPDTRPADWPGFPMSCHPRHRNRNHTCRVAPPASLSFFSCHFSASRTTRRWHSSTSSSVWTSMPL